MFKYISIISFSLLLSAQVAAADSWSQVVQFQTKMAKGGSVRAQFVLGEMYEQGRGVDKNLNQALQWYQKARQGGHKDAASRIAKVNYKIAHPEPEPVVVKAVAKLKAPEPEVPVAKAAKPVVEPEPAVESNPVVESKPEVDEKQLAEIERAKRQARYSYQRMGTTVGAFEDEEVVPAKNQNHLNNYVEAFE